MASASNQNPPGRKEDGTFTPQDDPLCRVQNVVPTGAIFAAALERLNRKSVIQLLEGMVSEIDLHCRTVREAATEEVDKLRSEILALLAGLRSSLEQQQSQAVTASQQLSELRLQLTKHTTSVDASLSSQLNRQLERSTPALVAQVTSSVMTKLETTVHNLVDLRVNSAELISLRVQIEHLQGELLRLKEAANEPSPAERTSIQALLDKLMASDQLSPLVKSTRVQIGGRHFALERILDVLATADQVEEVHIDYSDDDIIGARLVLTDRTPVVFVSSRREEDDGKQVHYGFRTADWKGLQASFVLVFERRTKELQLCGRTHVLASYNGVFHSNIKFDLCAQAAGRSAG